MGKSLYVGFNSDNDNHYLPLKNEYIESHRGYVICPKLQRW